MKKSIPNNSDSIKEAYRYFANAKETIAKSRIEYGRYIDPKYVSEAAGIAYLSALNAINAFLLSQGLSVKELPTSIEQYRFVVSKKTPHNGKLMAALNTVYENLHLLAYYRGGTDVKMIKSGFEKCKNIIQMMEYSLDKPSGKSMVNEPKEKYDTGIN